ncbi:hypothetical protein BH24BAC1_BH24BAC1_28720 [soil metagenome]
MRPVPLAIQEASSGLLMPSESDYPFEPVTFAEESPLPVPPALLLRWLNRPPDTSVETVELAWFFRHLTRESPEADLQEQEEAGRFRKLQQVIEQELADVLVYRVGRIQVEAYLLGKTPEGQIAGLKTTLIET